MSATRAVVAEVGFLHFEGRRRSAGVAGSAGGLNRAPEFDAIRRLLQAICPDRERPD